MAGSSLRVRSPFAGPGLFYEYFHGDTGRGVGASHQTGWTALVVRCIEDLIRRRTGAASRLEVITPSALRGRGGSNKYGS